jgi:hypothetical protein
LTIGWNIYKTTNSLAPIVAVTPQQVLAKEAGRGVKADSGIKLLKTKNSPKWRVLFIYH